MIAIPYFQERLRNPMDKLFHIYVHHSLVAIS